MGALDGVKIIDLTRVLAGPSCTQWLGDHGADVIKIEPPQGDETRTWGPPFDSDGAASYFLGVNRNKRGMSLDLRQEASRDVLRRLLRDADVLMENFKPGGMEKWGLGYETLREINPRLIHCRITGFGEDGPYGGLPGYDAVLQAQTGIMSVNGDPESGATRSGVPIVDIATGLGAAFAITAALFERTSSGEGQFIDMTLYDAGVALLFPYAYNYFYSGNRPRPLGNRHPNLTPYEKFKTATGEIFVGVGNDRQFAILARELGAPELAENPDYATMAARNVNRDALFEILQPLMLEHDGEALAERLVRTGAPAGPVQGTPEVVAHPHTAHRNMILNMTTSGGAEYRGLANPVKYSRTPAEATRTPPRFGEHTREVLAEAGYSDAEIAALLETGAAKAEG